MRVQIYTNDREQPIDLAVQDIRSVVREIRTGEHRRTNSIDETMREVIKDSTVGASANLLFTTADGQEGAIYLDTEKVAAVVTCWSDEAEPSE